VDAQGLADNDGDGLTNSMEGMLGTDGNNPDTDGDGFTDGEEVDTHMTDPLNADTDMDGLTDYDEVMQYGTLPLRNDTDGDGLSDGFEVQNGLDPLVDNTGIRDSSAFSPGCQAWKDGEVYKTRIPATVNFVYEVAIDNEGEEEGGTTNDVDEVTARMEEAMMNLVGRDLIKCDLLRRLNTRGSRRLTVDGIDPAPRDIVTQKTCTYYTATNPTTPPGTTCHVVQGLMTLYLREDSAASSTMQSSSRALRTLLNAMNRDDPSPFVEQFNGDNSSNDAGDDESYRVRGVRAVHFVKGTPDEGGVLLIDNSGGSNVGDKDGIDGATAGAANDGSSSSSSWDPLSPVGMSLIAIGAAGILGVALVAALGARKRRKRDSARYLEGTYAEFYDDESDLDMKHHGLYGGDGMTDVDAASLNNTAMLSPSPNNGRRRDVYGEEEGGEVDSIFSGLDQTPGTPGTPGDESKDPTFVHTRTSMRASPNDADAASIAVTAEHGYELGYASPEEASPNTPSHSLSSGYTPRSSIPSLMAGSSSPGYHDESRYEPGDMPLPTYEPKVPLERPTYEHPPPSSPERNNGRSYYVGDTVEF